jgi:hypothetical protein
MIAMMVIHQGVTELRSNSDLSATDLLSHNISNYFPLMSNSFLHQTIAYMSESTGTVMHMGEAASTESLSAILSLRFF